MSTVPAPQPQPSHPAPRRPALGMPHLAVIGLSLLAVPRVILHDLGLIAGGTFVNLLLVVAPVAIWIAVALLRRVPNPFLTLLVTGAWYGVLLALVHQLLWDVSFAGAPPRLGGALTEIAPVLEAVVVRTFAAGSSLATGLLVGAVGGLIALGIRAVQRGTSR